ncbi:DUF982 domain-containing protein [Mesorhizobium retamae]|uniref:DUF982 domain-containing protein n=1 Tax=Mesorhizobium retamae TaxID=2912854 RepID=A0ABS9QE87_9HYPH|nr:DUF982 domain-containing protein [Mesorhizobium sp. IRAMC:0171]MCG7505116.1 DUF982 domain-containing protein [Mesorhizobium sp. IRAMC:0171]
MTDLRFDNPVSIFMGLGFPRDVENVLEAYDVLLEWNGTRDSEHAAAIASCREAIARKQPAADARTAFERFAHNKGILTEEALDRAALTVAQEWGRLTA